MKGSVERERNKRKEMDSVIKIEQEELEDRKTQAQMPKQSKKKGKTNKGKKSKRTTATSPNTCTSIANTRVEATTEDFEDRLDYTLLLLRRNLCRGLVRYIAVLRQANLIR